jgi:hypothetical protein
MRAVWQFGWAQASCTETSCAARLNRDSATLPRVWGLDSFGRRFPSPEGRFENSPAVHCRVRIPCCISPEGTVESIGCLAPAPIPTLVAVFQPSLRDGRSLSHSSTLESVGYSQISLREMAEESSALTGQVRAGRLVAGCARLRSSIRFHREPQSRDRDANRALPADDV